MAEQDDDLVRLVAGAVRLGDRPLGPDQHRPVDAVTLAERADHLVTGHHRRRQRAQLGQVRGQIRVGVADHMPPDAVRPRRIGPDRGGQPGQYRSALAGLLGRDQPVECGADRDVTPDHLSQSEHRHAAVTFPRVVLGLRDVRHEVGTAGPVRASVVAGDDAPGDAGQAAGQPIELADLGPYEVLPVRVRCTGGHAARLAVHGPHHGQVDRPDELAQPPPRAGRSNRFGRHRRTVAARGRPRRRAALDQGGGHVEHRLVLIRVREVAHGHRRLVHSPRMPEPPAPQAPGPSRQRDEILATGPDLIILPDRARRVHRRRRARMLPGQPRLGGYGLADLHQVAVGISQEAADFRSHTVHRTRTMPLRP